MTLSTCERQEPVEVDDGAARYEVRGDLGVRRITRQPVDCPRCGLVNPPEALRCDCGWDFVARQARSRVSAASDTPTGIACNWCGVGVLQQAKITRRMRVPVVVACLGGALRGIAHVISADEDIVALTGDIGYLLIFVAVVLGATQRKVWRCTSCGHLARVKPGSRRSRWRDERGIFVLRGCRQDTACVTHGARNDE